MPQQIEWVANRLPHSADAHLGALSLEHAACARAFHRSFPQYAETPLARLDGLAAQLGLGHVFVKDESFRFGLNAFKVLGGSFAMANYIAQRCGRRIEDTDYAYLTSPALARDFGRATFFTATDGNHGHGVAWAARQLGQRAVVRMPKGTSPARFERVAAEGAEVTIEDANYDDCVRLAAAEAAACENGVIVQDTAWPGYEEIPTWIMQGYGTMAAEAADQLAAAGVERPTHVFVQAGVGSLAAAVVGYFANRFPENPPVFTVVEASGAPCLYESAKAGDGAPRAVTGDLPTIMAGLACGEPNPLAWGILRNHADAFVSCADAVTERGMRLLAHSAPGDPRVVSGESGAVGVGLVEAVMTDPALADLRAHLGLGPSSAVLVFSTEGDTDPERYRRIVGAPVPGSRA